MRDYPGTIHYLSRNLRPLPLQRLVLSIDNIVHVRKRTIFIHGSQFQDPSAAAFSLSGS